MNTELKNAFDTLRLKHGSHCAAAESIGIARDHYRRLRNGRANIPQRTAEYILLKAAEAEALPIPPLPPCTSSSTEARV